MSRAKAKPSQKPPRKHPGKASALDRDLFRMAFQNSPAMQSLIRASDGVIVEVNNTFLEKMHRTRDQVIGKTPLELYSWVEPGKALEYRQELETSGKVLGYEAKLRASNGKILTVLVSSHRVEIGDEPHYLNAGVDITPRKEAEAKLVESQRRLRESDARFSTAFHTNPVLMTIAGLNDAKFVEVNEAFIRFTGWKRRELIGRDSRELGLWVDLSAREKFFGQLRRDRQIRNVECSIRTRAGKIHAMLLSGKIIEINREPHLITFGLDLSEQKRAEAELKKALRQERELSQLKTDFVSLVSHEFRTPLEIIISSTDNLQRYHARLPAEKREQLLGTIHKAVRRMAGMMEEVLVLGRVESGKTEFKPAPFDLQTFCERIRDEIQTASGKHCEVAVQTDGELHNALGDENLLRHILTNLLSNAVKYSPAGKGVILKASRKRHWGVFQVIDRGCGIPIPDQARLFQAFHRGSNVRQLPGTGLGLVIVKRCVDLHGGEIQCQSGEGKGTTFAVTLPLFANAPEVRRR